jgi:hypothetical protein
VFLEVDELIDGEDGAHEGIQIELLDPIEFAETDTSLQCFGLADD